MKDKIIAFFIGLFLGAIISTGSIYFYSTMNNNKQGDMQMPNGMNNQNGMPNNMQPGQGNQNEANTQSN